MSLMVLRQVAHDSRIAEKFADIAVGEYQIEMVGAVGFLCELEFSLQAHGLALHHAQFARQSAP